MCSGKKYLLETQPSAFHKMGSSYIHTGSITYNRGVVGIKTDSSLLLPPRSTRSLLQPSHPAYPPGAPQARPREAGWEERVRAPCKGAYQTRRPAACRAATDQSREKRTVPPSHKPR